MPRYRSAVWPCALTLLAHIIVLVRKDMLVTDEAAQVRGRSVCLLFFTFTRNCIRSFKTITVNLNSSSLAGPGMHKIKMHVQIRYPTKKRPLKVQAFALFSGNSRSCCLSFLDEQNSGVILGTYCLNTLRRILIKLGRSASIGLFMTLISLHLITCSSGHICFYHR